MESIYAIGMNIIGAMLELPPSSAARVPSGYPVNSRQKTTLHKPPLTIVLDGNQRSALATTRSLGRRGVRVIVAEVEKHPLAGSSRFCSATVICPDAGTAPQAYREWLQNLDRQYPGAVLMPMTDVTTPLILQSRALIPQLRVALPELHAYEAVTDKLRLFELAKAANVRVPATMVVTRGTLEQLRAEDFEYPVVVKPRQSAMRLDTGMAKRGVRYAGNARELKLIVAESLLDDSDELLLQEYVTGQGAGVFGLYAAGKPLFFFAHRRLRERPPSGGVSVLSESVAVPEEGVAAANRLLEPLQWHGVAMIEFKIDSQGRLWLIEINARLWGSLQLAIDSGADFPWFLHQLATTGTASLPGQYTIGKRLRWWLGDLDNLYARLRSRGGSGSKMKKLSAIGEFMLPWQPGLRYEFLRWSDPGPALAAFRQYAEALRGTRKSI
jgi:predicted ATP-grasp superfamily ATP-dependent carboligase